MYPDLFSLKGRCALVTGGSKGIGKAIARIFAEAGADVAICARHEDEVQRAVAEIQSGLDVNVAGRVTDLAEPHEVKELADWAHRTLGKVDIVVNNAGGNKPQNLVDTTDEVWEYILELNFTACMRLAKYLVPEMIERKWGRVIHISSVMAFASVPGRGLYSATKAALIGMSRAHALELGPHGITVNCLAPGPVATDLPMSLLSDEQKKAFAERTCIKRWAEPVDMAGPALLLASEAGAYITGNVILADGGMLCRTFD